MRTKELDVIHSVANRIAHFEQKQTSDVADSSVNTSVMMNNCNQKHKSHRLTPSSFGQRYLDLDDIMEEESSIEDEEERSQGDSDTGYIAGSNEETSSPDTSFRLSGRSSSSSSSDHSGDIGGEVRETEEENTDNNKGHKAGISEKLSQKSLDSGFSDFSDSRDTREGGESREAKRREMKSSVVHETHATKDAKLHHVSKVYFYSVSDLLTQQSNSTEFEDHLTLLKNESSNTCSSSSGHSNPTTPRISSSVCDEDFFDRVESPFIPITSPSSQISRDSPLQRCPRVHTGTSSLRRKATAPASSEDTEAKTGSWTESPSESPVRRCLTPSQSPFPITNGSLYSDLSLTRRNKETQKRKSKSKSDLASSSSTEADNQNNNNPPESPYQSLNGSLPLESYGLNVSSSR